MPAPEGKVLRWVGTCTDIDDQKENEAELRRVNRELEEFAYVASHDLQEPLRMVNIYTQLILKQIGEKTQGSTMHVSQYTGFVQQGVSRMEALIHDLLTFSRTVHTDELSIGVGRSFGFAAGRLACSRTVSRRAAQPLRRRPCQRFAVTRRSWHMSSRTSLERAEVSPERPRPADPYLRGVGTAGHWVISVRDNGIGFEQQYAERIFGLFKRLHKEEYPGTGLGLAICKRIIERYGGRMWAEGKPGEGATFRFTLPRIEDR